MVKSLYHPHEGVVMSAETRQQITVGQITVRFLLEGDDTEGAVAMFEFDVPAGARVPVPHSHDGYEETVYGLSGTLTWTVEGDVTEVGSGEALCIRRGAVHHFENLGTADATALAVVTPGILGAGYFRELEALVRDAGGPPDPAAMAAVMRRHGLTPAV
jgi:quercetin dioxygenase-like cupin family protein